MLTQAEFVSFFGLWHSVQLTYHSTLSIKLYKIHRRFVTVSIRGMASQGTAVGWRGIISGKLKLQTFTKSLQATDLT